MTAGPTGVSLPDLVRRVAEQARPGEQIEAFAARGRSFGAKAYAGEVESVTSSESAGIGIRVVVGGRQGFAHAGTLDEAAVAEVLAEARDNVPFGEPQEWNGLAEPDGRPEPELVLYSPEIEDLTPADKVAIALELERAVRAADPRITGVRSAAYGDGVGEAAIATSTGIAAHSRSSSAGISASALAQQGDEVQIAGAHQAGRHAGSLVVGEVAAEAARRAVALLGATPIPSQRLTVVFEKRVAATLLGVASGMLSGEALVKGRTPFAGRVGEPIASPLLTLLEDATNPASLGADTTDAEGLATRPTMLVEGGVLRGFLHNTVTGRRSGSGTTASAVRGYASTPGVGSFVLVPTAGPLGFDELLAMVGEGLYVTSLSGLHSGMNPVSGDLSVGVQGALITGGALGQPVREITVATSIQRLLLDLVAIGGDLEWLPGGDAAMTLVAADLAVSGS